MSPVPDSLRFLTGARVYLDTNVFIYGVEGGEPWQPLWSTLWAMAQSRKLRAVTSELSLAEALVGPIRRIDRKAQAEFHSLIAATDFLAVISIDRHILLEASRLRALHGLEMADAIHAATAKTARCNHFLTNDAQLAVAAGSRAVLLQRLKDEFESG